MIDHKTYIKRLTTIQNMTDKTDVKEVCELLMELLEELTKQEIGFKGKTK